MIGQAVTPEAPVHEMTPRWHRTRGRNGGASHEERERNGGASDERRDLRGRGDVVTGAPTVNDQVNGSSGHSSAEGPSGDPSAIVDWSLARRISEWTASRKALPPSYRQVALQSEFDEVVSQAEVLVATCTGLTVSSGPTRARVTDRAGWASANVSSFQRLLGPTLERLESKRSTSPVAKLGPLTSASRMASGAQLGLILAWLSGRVLGQYDLLLTDQASEDGDVVYFVGPNVVQMENRHGFPTASSDSGWPCTK